MTSLISQGNGVPTMTPRHHANNDTKTRFVDALFADDWDTMAALISLSQGGNVIWAQKLA